MPATIELGGITLDVLKRDVRNVHLSVHPPAGHVTIVAPRRMSLDTIRLFGIAKLQWIKRQQRALREQAREPKREYLDCESHCVWGKRYLLKVIEEPGPASIELQHSRLVLRVRPDTDQDGRDAVIAAWYRKQLRAAVPPLIATWKRRLRVSPETFYVQHMKTKWGSCNTRAGTIRLNTELAKKPSKCLEYIVVHEMIHLLERSHGPRFIALMDRHLPDWRETRALLNRLPARHERWTY